MSLIAAIRKASILALMLPFGIAVAEPLDPSEEQRQAAIEVAESLRYGHYADVSLDDEWSRQAFDRYLNVLDSQRAYLLQRDVEAFEDLETEMDDALLSGELERPFALYKRFQERQEDRLNWILDKIDAGLDFSFDDDERLELDREDASRPRRIEELDDLWRKRLKNAALTLALSEQDDDAIEENLRQRYEGQLTRLEQTSSEDVFGLFMAAVNGTIDPHTEYLSPRQGESFDIQMRLSLEGIGAMLQSENEYVKVSSLVPGGPAEKSGKLEPADRIVAVGQEDSDEMVNVIGMRLDDVVELIRGPKGSVVKLEIVPAQAVDITRTETIEITRDTVNLEDQAASSEVVEVERDGTTQEMGVIEIPNFYVDFDAWQAGEDDYRSTTRDVAKEIEKLKEANVEGIILDLRNNGGGALQEANSLIGLFIDRGPTVQVRDARGRISLYGDTEQGVLYDGPLGVMVNRLSASASEIFAGAIQDYGRGLVLGNRTFGKGTVQAMNELSHGEIKLTRAKFYRISGESTQHRGVEPDITYPSLIDPDDIGESSLDNALEWDTVREVQYRQYGTPEKYLDELTHSHEKRINEDPNFVYLQRQAELAKRLREQHTSVSLNRDQRQREMDAQEREQLSLENQRREALGMEPIEDWSEARGDEDDETLESESGMDAVNGTDNEPIDRAQIIESAEILLDYAQLTREE
ncbi:carboxy terminal-processing peptidase [Aidingimonas halophila]|uniref:C-terminal processing peptidase-1. Serine peptidase. MEROPS family S41A n=1 Tax=Aidingimonas halophila TaxID=574349 RepID=A0A1H3EZI9_9GAMM|nr:carboxy terminal-processing peptidase [Aidingimonas halophila]GHC32026.1 tail-specific protease [Aidingimonas halophila]SDX83987.1 C-terminal processing peptidase-1. Serine peptidase. MEROPS family S41A [Aidingimonas halophila]